VTGGDWGCKKASKLPLPREAKKIMNFIRELLGGNSILNVYRGEILGEVSGTLKKSRKKPPPRSSAPLLIGTKPSKIMTADEEYGLNNCCLIREEQTLYRLKIPEASICGWQKKD